MSQHHGAGKLIICTAGIFVCYFYFAILQEKLTRGQYVDGDNTEKFTYMFALVFAQCAVNCIFAKLLLVTVMKQEEDTTKNLYYATSALTYLLAMVSSNMALQFVNYPTQVVAKAAKPIPIMIMGSLIGGKVYSFKKYCFVTLIVTGVVIFMYKDNVPLKTIEGEGFGKILLVLSLMMDSLTSTIQEKMRGEHKTKSGHMMFNMNMWSVFFSGVVVLFSGELFNFLKFLQRHPAALHHIITLSICGALGQYFIFLTVSEFGPLTCSVATTTRKCFTVIASVIFFGNSLLPRQWLATFFVFLGLFLDSFYGKTKL
ncbi:PREDICTED: solute carrier family 35 member B1 [Ceratosolen solmsi marchali]|uniref:Solute carrier family 35 member B1 n=1 Tax=Ceratosolen solmsi marchali TaxID=326594 RepID=A0AAJ7DX39_9HYME|nr:PREDICTED: solute carrier family 35 member B1 [Ceratosolen solmsi marchali]